MGATSIEWTEATWNPVTGCSKVSPGCEHCYAEKLSHRFGWTDKPWTAAHAAENVKLHPDRLEIPLKWKKPRMIFVNSMSDLFHEQLPFEFIRQVFDVMAEANWHTFQVLTKRPDRMLEFLAGWPPDGPWKMSVPAHIWIGVTAEDQRRADERIPLLLQVKAAVRFLSCEPLLGPINLHMVPHPDSYFQVSGRTGVIPVSAEPDDYVWATKISQGIDWVIAGGESGPGARPMHPEWARSIRDQCQDAGVPFFFKQWGEWAPGGNFPDHIPSGTSHNFGENLDDNQAVWRVGKKAAGRMLDGRTWDKMPQR